MRDRSPDRRRLGLFTGRPRAVVVAAGLGVALLSGPVASTTSGPVASPYAGSSYAQPTRTVAVPVTSTAAPGRTVQNSTVENSTVENSATHHSTAHYDVRDARHPRSSPAATRTTTPPPPRTPPPPSTVSARVTVTATTAAPTTTTAPTSTTSPTTTSATTPTATNPATVRPFYVDPNNPAAKQVRAWQASGRTADAQVLRRIADQPQAHWVTSDVGGVTGDVDGTADRAQAAHAKAVFVAYDIPGRDCGQYSAGGAGGGAQYDQWLAGFASGLAGRRAVVVLEPDAIPQQLSGCGPGDARYTALAHAVDTLKAAGAEVYLDAGNPGWITDIDALAAALARAGVQRAAGFSVNVSNFTPTATDIAYGKKISAKLGGKHFIVDTSRNGALSEPTVTSGPAWCNPSGRKLGPVPTTSTGDPLVDAFLWIKTPGESDGACRGDEPPAGGWMPEYALGLAS